MLHALLILAAAKAEPSKTAFYIVGGAWAGWAVVLGALGMRSPDFPNNSGAARGIMAVSTVLMLGAMTAAVATS